MIQWAGNAYQARNVHGSVDGGDGKVAQDDTAPNERKLEPSNADQEPCEQIIVRGHSVRQQAAVTHPLGEIAEQG
jgi:hypothetical protein